MIKRGLVFIFYLVHQQALFQTIGYPSSIDLLYYFLLQRLVLGHPFFSFSWSWTTAVMTFLECLARHHQCRRLFLV